ncbi:hypothetical protein RUM43_014648 [Polyplax serrata]|uniref:WD repeat-containing protein 89 n=1 Tax=Polyplax serrata TaxID=468196 RepID=A0AAN8PGE8_POLSC
MIVDKLELLGINSSPNTDDILHNVRRTDATDYSYHITVEQAVGLEKTYITDMVVKELSDCLRFAVALSNKSCMVYNLSNTQFSSLAVLQGHEKSISNVRFSPKSDNVVYTGSLDGRIRIWDLRRQNCVRELKDETGMKPLSCFDVSFDDRFICAGTELYDGDAFILFWDIRSRKLLGGYWESHTDDLTQVAFHPEKADLIATGSVDGLINLFDISQTCEDDALKHSLNTESSVGKVRWHKNNSISCITHTEVVQLWNMEGGGPDLTLSREDTAEALQKLNSDDSYVVDIHQKSNDNLFLIAGSAGGKGECLKVLEIEKNKVTTTTEFVGNRQIVRTSTYNPLTKMLCTAGESGYISVWKPGEPSEKSNSGPKKVSKARNKHKSKPY